MKDKEKIFLMFFLLMITSAFLFTICKNIYRCDKTKDNIIKLENNKFDTQHDGIFQDKVKNLDKNNLKDVKEKRWKKKKNETEEGKKIGYVVKRIKKQQSVLL